MKPKDMFNLAVRLLGLVFLYHGLRDLPLAIGTMVGAFPHKVGLHVTTQMSVSDLVAGVVMAAWPLLLAYWLLRGAPLLIRIAYPDAQASTKTKHWSEEGLSTPVMPKP